ncbi:MAG: PEGA domain-containing protein [Patescibacteria group bacterium]|nr:PEGA domain-containing protein [Patescibacteria group bacterium]
MKAKIILLLVLFAGFGVFLVMNFFVTDQKNNQFGVLEIKSFPISTIFINNLAVGRTPFEQKFQAGEFLIKLIPEGSATETASWNGKISIYKNAKTFVNIELGKSDIFSAGEIFTVQKASPSVKRGFGEIYVETEPQGAIVTLNNQEKGIAPLFIENVPEGNHELSVLLPGFFRRTQKINVDSGFRINGFFKLALDENQRKVEDLEKEATLSAQIAREKKKFVLINKNPQGWLRVRSEPKINSTEEARVKIGEKFEFIEEKNGWYRIKFNNNPESLISGEFIEGWVWKEYASLVEEE